MTLPRDNSLLPPNATPFELAVDAAALDAFEYARDYPVVWDVDLCPVELLPYLAVSLSVDVWDDDWPEAQKRLAIRNAVFIHRHRGTIGAIRRAVAAFDLGIQISRWFEHGGDPYTFRADVLLTERGVSQDEIPRILRAIHRSKAARSWLEALKMVLLVRGQPAIGAVGVSGAAVLIDPYNGGTIEATAGVYVASAQHAASYLTIGAAA